MRIKKLTEVEQYYVRSHPNKTPEELSVEMRVATRAIEKFLRENPRTELVEPEVEEQSDSTKKTEGEKALQQRARFGVDGGSVVMTQSESQRGDDLAKAAAAKGRAVLDAVLDEDTHPAYPNA